MNETTLALVAAGCAGAMVLLVRAGVDRELRAAARTTMVLLIGWVFVWRTSPFDSWGALPRRTWLLLALSCLALATAWTVYFRRARKRPPEGALTIDQINIGFAVLFAVILFGAQQTSQSLVAALGIVCVAIILARK